MMEEWIEYNLDSIIDDPKKIIDVLNHHEPFLTGVSKKGKSVQIFELSKDLKTIKEIKL